MNNQDWSLVFFTTLSQLSVGIVLCFSILYYYQSDLNLVFAKGFSLKNPLLLALIFISLAAILSLSHLGQPLRAFNSLSNLKGSWMSREILGLGIYVFLLLLAFILNWQTEAANPLKILIPIIALSGLCFIWFMVRIYTIPTIPSWSHWNTPVSFVSTMIILGFIAILILKFYGFIQFENYMINRLIMTILMVLFVEICVGFIHQFRIEGLQSNLEELMFNKGTFYTVFLIRMILLIIGFIGILITITKPDLFTGNTYLLVMYVMFFLIIIQEFMGRLLFYSSYFRVGV